MIIVKSVRITVFDTSSRFEVCFSCANGVLRPLKLTGSFYLSRSGSNLWGEILRPLKGPLRFKALQGFEKGTRELLEGTEDIPDVRSSISGLQMIFTQNKRNKIGQTCVLADIFDVLNLEEAATFFPIVEENVVVWKEELFFAQIKNNLLRICNDLLRRLSRTQVRLPGTTFGMTDHTLKDTLHIMSEKLFVVYLGHCFLWTNPSLLGPILSFLGEVRAERHLRVQPGQRHCLLRRTTWWDHSLTQGLPFTFST